MDGWTTLLYALLPHPEQALVLMQNIAGQIALPRRLHNDRVWVADTHVLNPLLEELTGVPINILRYVGYHLDEEMRQLYCIYLLELRGENLPPDGLWQPPEKILEDRDLHSALQERLKRWQHEQSSGILAERRAPWAISGWYAEVEHWIKSQILRLGRGAIQRIEPIKSWSISCVLKVVTETGDLYFKASRDLPLFVNEGVVLVRLAELFPDCLPVPVALSHQRGWMLLDDFGHPLGRDAAIDQQAHFMQDFARMQIDSSRKTQELLAAGCKDRRLETLPSHIEPLFEDELVLSLLTLEEREKLKPITPRLRDLIAELVALPIPVALLHGDLHAGNVVLQKNSFLYFDWTDAAVSHPFFDMIHIFMEEDEIKRNALQEAYLLVWEEYYPKADVRRAWELASVVYGLYHAVSYQYIVNGIEELVQPELNYAYFFLRKLLEGIQRLDSN